MSKPALKTMGDYLYPSFIICETGMFDVIEDPRTVLLDAGQYKCRLCAMPIDAGLPLKCLPKGITNMTDIACPHEPYVCEFCDRLTKKDAVSGVQGYRGNKDVDAKLFGMIYIGGDDPRYIRVLYRNAMKFVLTPPVPKGTPFVFMRRVPGTLKNPMSRHSAWMARVSLNTSNYYLQVGTDALQVDVSAVKAAITILKKSPYPGYPITKKSADYLIKNKIIKGDEDARENMEALSCYSHDTILVAAHLIRADESAAELKAANSKKRTAKKEK